MSAVKANFVSAGINNVRTKLALEGVLITMKTINIILYEAGKKYPCEVQCLCEL